VGTGPTWKKSGKNWPVKTKLNAVVHLNTAGFQPASACCIVWFVRVWV